MASLEELQGKLADIQAKTKRIERLQAALTATQAEIDAIPGRRMALETAQASEAAARDVGVKQLFLGQLASDPRSIVLDVESLSSTKQHMAVVQALLQAGNFAGLKVTEVTLKLTLAPLAVPSSVSVSDDIAVAPVDDKEGGAEGDDD